MPEAAAACPAAAEVGAVAVPQGPVQLLAKLGRLVLVQAAGQLNKPESLVMVDLPVTERRRSPAP
ncbi:MAG TPA: hypothetical protein VGC06_02495 [Actinomycetes bacterium]